ncbi:MAG: deoxyuridine 5'-triphosphate nucleotidohydrolase [Lachnospiraceae bacterium]|nr:deoxyuridine 5'-triphosphate nucleotidohydrolase [Lachnospiraceae bacterium]
MQRVGEFEKISFEKFSAAMEELFGIFCTVDKMYNALQLPVRSTSGSAGYDFKAPFDFTLAPGKSIKIPTGIRVKINDGWWLGCFPRSGLGFKYRVQLDNTIGVVDSDYYNSDNEGHIFAKITNDSKEGKTLTVKAGEAFMQGIFIPYGLTYSDNASGVRNGGMGSTDKPVVEFGSAIIPTSEVA